MINDFESLLARLHYERANCFRHIVLRVEDFDKLVDALQASPKD